MILPRIQRGTGVSIRRGLAALIAVAALHLVAAPVAAQSTAVPPVDATPVAPDGKGIVGMGLIGTELGFAIPALAGARDTWMYIVFPIAGAGGGAALGYFWLEKGASSPDGAIASLVTGMALIIPTMIITLSKTAYDPAEDAELTGRVRMREAQARSGFAQFDGEQWQLAAPALGIVPDRVAASDTPTGLQVGVLSGQF
jgi:hypothetical protein